MSQPVTFSDTDIDGNWMFDEFHDNLTAHIERHAPLIIKVSQKNLKLKSKSWINDKIQKLIKHIGRLSLSVQAFITKTKTCTV